MCPSTEQVEVHHRQPVEHGGRDNPANLVVLCSRCHHDVTAGRLDLDTLDL